MDASNQQFYRQAGSGIRVCGSCPQVTGPYRWERKGPCISTPAATHQTLPATALALRKLDLRDVMMAGGLMTWELKAAVSTRQRA
jgi:hypothetical protein